MKPNPSALDAINAKIYQDLESELQGRRVFYIDIPIHFNIGDTLIEEGTHYLFQSCGVTLEGQLSIIDAWLLPNLKIDKSTLIILHGGGNFGDLYPKHQALRLSVIQQFPENRIIMLPQSVHYDCFDQLKEDAIIINRHQNIKLFVRDEKSLQLLSQTVDPKNRS